jgi:iron complex outermembrane receptor protein
VSSTYGLAASAALIGLSMAAGVARADTVDADAARGSDSVVVTAKRETTPTLDAVPGGTAVISTANLQAQSIANTADALAFVPGLFAQSVQGGEGTRLSIRGSGAGKGGFTWGSGIQVLLDGLPLSTPYGNPYEAYEPNAYNAIEVYKGDNGFEYGAFTLGGVINYIEHTGYDSSPLFVRAEGGSYGYQREQVSSGQVIGPFDYYISLNHYNSTGYLSDSAGFSNRLVSNFGYKFTPDLSTRFYFEYADQTQQHINSVTLANFEANARANIGVIGDRINPGTYVVADKTVYVIDGKSTLEVGIEYQKPPIHDSAPSARSFWDTSDVSGLVKYKRQDVLFGGHESDTTVAFLPSYVLAGSQLSTYNTLTTPSTYLGSIKYGGSNNTLLASNDFAVTSKLWLTTGIAGLWLNRQNQITNPLPAGVNPDLNKTYQTFTPRVGLRYAVTPRIQAYANVSRLVEAPQIGSFAQSLNSAYTGYVTTPTVSNGVSYVLNTRNLKVQSGISSEIGVKGQTDRFKWDVDYYNEQVRDELLTTYAVLPGVDPKNPNGISYTENARPTVHEGVEASLDATLWKDQGSELTLRQSYAWGHFYFAQQGPEQKVLPGLPKQTYQAELTFNHASGLYVSANVQAVDSYPVDFANAGTAPAYALAGASIGYVEPHKKWRVFVEGQNLGGVNYVSFTSTTGLWTPSAAVYTPGEGRTITAGASYAF